MFQERHPDARIRLHQVGFDDRRCLADEGADVAFCWLPLPGDAGLQWRVLFTEPASWRFPSTTR